MIKDNCLTMDSTQKSKSGFHLPRRLHAHSLGGIRGGMARENPQRPPFPTAGLQGMSRASRRPRRRRQSFRLHRPLRGAGSRRRTNRRPKDGQSRRRRNGRLSSGKGEDRGENCVSGCSRDGRQGKSGDEEVVGLID